MSKEQFLDRMPRMLNDGITLANKNLFTVEEKQAIFKHLENLFYALDMPVAELRKSA